MLHLCVSRNAGPHLSHTPHFSQVQLLLFSATFNDIVKKFAMQIAPKANHLFVAKEELSLDVIAQYNVRCGAQMSDMWTGHS